MIKTKGVYKDIQNFGSEFWTPEEFLEWARGLVEESKPFKDPLIYIEAEPDPYEDSYSVSVKYAYQIPLSPSELKQEEKQKEVEAFAKEKGIGFYEASVILNLKERGKL